jgi:hypothetical protein
LDKLHIKKEILDEWIDLLPEEGARVFHQLLMSYQSKRVISALESWIENIDDESPIDIMLCNLVLNLICDIGQGVEEMMQNNLEHGATPTKPTEIAISKMRLFADTIETKMNESNTNSQLWH